MTTIVNYRAKEKLDDFEVIQSQITANALFNFMREYSYLEKAILNMAICPRYYPEDISYLNLKYNSKDLTEWYIPMTCFCDIPLH
ncbi:TPA: abortive phage resistance protein, partial [Streptococcus suis]|nr:abortive phage resistance protein [Streptococcus suis]